MTGGLARWTAHCPRRAGAPARLCICAPLRTDGRPMAMCFSIASPPGCIGLLGCGHARQAPSQRQRQRHPWATEGMNARDKGQSKASSPVGSAGNPSLHPAISHMLSRLLSPVRSRVPSDPLRILFCGSDDFSSASLRALAAAKRGVPGLIDSIHVVHRPPKPAGRGLKSRREGKRPPHSGTMRQLTEQQCPSSTSLPTSSS